MTMQAEQSELLEFFWRVPLAGYRVVELPAGQFLAEREPLSERSRSYAPLREPGLFRSFADLKPQPDSVIEFANRYGLLGIHPELLPCQSDSGPLLGEPLSQWYAEAAELREFLTLWDAAREGDRQLLAERIRWDGSKAVYYQGSHSALIVSADTAYGWRLLESMPVGDLIRPALLHLQQVLNAKLAENRLSAALRWDAGWRRLQLHFVPVSLVGALWLQFALAVDSNPKFRRCEACGRWFKLAPGTARADKLFCSNACRARAHRRRQAEARALHASGLCPAEIAARLGSNITTVEKWLALKA